MTYGRHNTCSLVPIEPKLLARLAAEKQKYIEEWWVKEENKLIDQEIQRHEASFFRKLFKRPVKTYDETKAELSTRTGAMADFANDYLWVRRWRKDEYLRCRKLQLTGETAKDTVYISVDDSCTVNFYGAVE